MHVFSLAMPTPPPLQPLPPRRDEHAAARREALVPGAAQRPRRRLANRRLSTAASSTFGIVAIADYVTRVVPALPPEQRPLQCTQRAGDVMYVPYAWGHGCFNTQTSFGFATEVDTDYGRYSRL